MIRKQPISGEQYRIMQKDSQSVTAVPAVVCEEDVVLNLTISGAREQILSLLEQMDAVPGFSVVKGSFIVSTSRNSSV
jgi:hypothetical protein